MGCMASKELAGTDVEAVTPGACTVFGAKYLVPHGKRVYLAFSKDTSSSFDILDVTNGSGPESMILFHVQVESGTESQSDAHLACFTVRDPCLSNGTSVNGNAPPLLWVAKETRCVYVPDPDRGGMKRLLFSLSENNGMTQDLTSPRNPNQHIYVQNKVDWEQQSSVAPAATDATASSRGAIILLNSDPLNKNKTQMPIARVCSADDDGDDLQRLGLGPPSDFLQGHVILQVAPGVDTALMTAMVLLSIASSARC